jgi:hypothetical protein
MVPLRYGVLSKGCPRDPHQTTQPHAAHARRGRQLMPKLRIPDQYRAGADELSRLPDQAIQELYEVLLKERPMLRPKP